MIYILYRRCDKQRKGSNALDQSHTIKRYRNITYFRNVRSTCQQPLVFLQVRLTTAHSRFSWPPLASEWFRQICRKLPNIPILYPIYDGPFIINAVASDPMLLIYHHHYGSEGNNDWGQYCGGCDHEHNDHLQLSCLVDGSPPEDGYCHHSWDSNNSYDTIISGMPSEVLARKKEKPDESSLHAVNCRRKR